MYSRRHIYTKSTIKMAKSHYTMYMYMYTSMNTTSHTHKVHTYSVHAHMAIMLANWDSWYTWRFYRYACYWGNRYTEKQRAKSRREIAADRESTCTCTCTLFLCAKSVRNVSLCVGVLAGGWVSLNSQFPSWMQQAVHSYRGPGAYS